MTQPTTLDWAKAYAPSGTHMGSALATGSGFLSGANNASYQGVQSSDFGFESFMPTADINAFNMSAISVPAGTARFLPLSNYEYITPPLNTAYMTMVEVGNQKAIKLDYPRSFAISCNQPFQVIISGYDRFMQKCNMIGSVVTPVSGVYTYQMVRCLLYVTSIYVQNNGASPTNFSVNMNQTIEMPFWNISTAAGVSSSYNAALYPLIDIKYSRIGNSTFEHRSIYYFASGSSATTGAALGANLVQGIATPVLNNGVTIPNPLTAFAGTPRVWLLLAAPFTTYFPFDQMAMVTTYFNNSTLFTNSKPTYDYNFNEKTSYTGPPNFFDNSWAGWQG